MDDFDDEENVASQQNILKEPCPGSPQSGVKFVDDVLNGSNASCCENFRMDKQLFYKLCGILQAKGLLRHTNKIKIEVQLAIFLFTIGHNQRTRAIQERFQYSGETISRHFNNVLSAILKLSSDYFPPPECDTPREILDDPLLHPYFKDCIGAVDGIHIPVMVGVDEQGPFRNKYGFLSQNVMAACSFELQFDYVLAGWEGSARDLSVLSAAITRANKLYVPEGKYYLVDEEYANMPGFIAPYHGFRYHLSEFAGDDGPRNARELFNHRHSRLRNVIQRTFKIWRERFPIFMSPPPYPLRTQVKLVVATCVLHNYIRREKKNDWLFSMYEDNRQEMEMEMEIKQITTHLGSQVVGIPYEGVELEIVSERRDAIASEMWNDLSTRA